MATVAGLGVLLAVWAGPLPGLAPEAFVAHMAMHMGVVAVAAPLLALGLAGGPLDPVPRAPAVFAPVAASVAELIVVWAWHAPVLHHAARARAWALVLEQGSFLAAGLAVWLSAVGGRARDRGRAGAGALGLLLASMHMTLLGALLGLAGRPLYDHPVRLHWGLTPLEDQHLGGALMLILGGVVYLAGGLALVRVVLRSGGGRRIPAPGRGGGLDAATGTGGAP